MNNYSMYSYPMMNTNGALTVGTSSTKAHKGPAMEGFIATWYAKITKGEARQYRACAESVAARVPPGGSILDLAAGPGYLAIELAKLGRFRVSGLDISKTFVRIATDNARAGGVSVEFREGNAARMPYADASFDFVVCRAAFKNFTDPVGVLEEIKALVDDMKLSALSAWWTRLTFRFFLLKNAYSREAIERVATQSRFGGCELRESGVEFDLRLAKQ
jgi:SAM-dependent methyltransferase